MLERKDIINAYGKTEEEAAEEETCFYVYDYEPLLKLFGEIIIQEDQDSYQGDSYLLYRNKEDKEKYGFLAFGWGSCSGCDSLQACENYNEILELAIELENSIVWKTREEIIEYIEEAEKRNEYYLHEETYQIFVEKVRRWVMQTIIRHRNLGTEK